MAREVWATDILNERSFLWLVASRLFILMAGSLIVTFGTFYLAQSFGYDETQTKTAIIELLAAVVVGTVVAVVPASRISDRLGRKPVIYASCALGATGLAIVAVAPSLPVALPGVVLFGVSAGSFLAVDWALLTDIVPKASAGRYMGISNVATASCGLIAQIVGGAIVMDIVNQLVGYGAGPRAAMLMGVIAYGIGAVMLVPVQERRNRAAGREASLPA